MDQDGDAGQQDGFQLVFEPLGDSGLRAQVTGHEDVCTTQAYWEAILAEVRQRRPRWLLLVDELRGPPLEPEDWQALVDRMRGSGLELVRIAHVKPHGLDRVEYCEIFALEAGFEARVFVDEAVAAVWARYGSGPAEAPATPVDPDSGLDSDSNDPDDNG